MLALALGALGGLNPLAGASAGPEGLEETSPAGVGLAAVVRSHDLLDGLAGLIGVVEGDGADIVVKNMGFNDAMEDVATDEAKVTINGSSSSTGEVPRLGLVVGEGGVGVLEESDGNEPVVYPEVRNAVPDKKVEPAIGRSDVVEEASRQEETEIAQDDQLGILGLIQGARGVEVIDTTEVAVPLALAAPLGLALVVVVAGDIGQEVHGPSEQLLENEVGRGQDGGLLHQFAELMSGTADAGGIFFPGLGNEDHITSEVTGGLVVLAVGDLPGEVRDEQKGVADPSDSVVQDLGRRESLMTALVCQNPNTSTDQTLNDGVKSPQDDAHRHGWHRLGGYIVVEDIEDGRKDGEVLEDIVQTLDGRALVAVGRDGIPDLLDGVIGNLELVTIGVEHLAAGVLSI